MSHQRDFSTDSIISITEALKVFQEQKNSSGAGTCYMVLGCMFASLTEELNINSQQNFFQSIRYISEAEKIQQLLIYEQMAERSNPRSRFFQVDHNSMIEEKFMLAFRYYTRGIISLNYFILNQLKNGDFDSLFELKDSEINRRQTF